ncbi:MAG: M23 family metallopeptidase [Chlorobiaceae bacterium]|nr:M23 family metallopeptidase [Chlorobiaceae bacterium]NTV61043.1 M23 family metallopeptidase [Chlorobiaceae bacterium]
MNLIATPSPHCGNSQRRIISCRFAAPLLIVLALLFQPAPAACGEKEPVAKKTAEGLLTTTEEMIENLILQIDNQNAHTPERIELADISNPTPFSESIPSIRPLNGPISSEFGMRVHPIRRTTLFHAGVDISVSSGTKVLATGDGVVSFAGWEGGYGQKVTITHGYGFRTTYAHLSKAIVRAGQRIHRGDIIALSGNTGMSTGPHLHYEVMKNGVHVNPVAYFDGSPEKMMTDKNDPEKTDNNS